MRRIYALLLLLTSLAGAAADPLAVGSIPADLLGRTPASDEVRISQLKGRVRDNPRDYGYIRKQLGDTPMTFTRDRSGAISRGFGVEGYPNLFVIDQTGAVAAIHVGFGDDSFKAILDDVIALLEHPVRAVPAAAPSV